MNVLVLGAKGVVGEAVTKHFKSKGYNVIEWDIKIDSSHDLRVRHSLYFLLKEKNIDFAIFLAFDVGGSKYKVDSHDYISNNMRLMDYTFESLSAFKIPFIHSTSQMSNMDHNPYGPLKRIGEFYTEYLGGVNVKIWNVYGPEEVNEKSHVLNDFVHQARTNKCIKMMTSGKEMRQFLHGEDFAKALIKVIENFEILKGKTIDISNFEWVSILDVAHIVAKQFDAEVIPGFVEATFQTKVNEPSEAILQLNWKPEISLIDGIKQLVQGTF